VQLEHFEVVGDVLSNKVANLDVESPSEAPQPITDLLQIDGAASRSTLGLPEVLDRIGYPPFA
jgi:hypothetical protein